MVNYTNVIINRFPELKEDDFKLVGKKGIISIEFWNSQKPVPSPEEIQSWVEEDMANYVPPLTTEEELKQVKHEQDLMKAALDDVIFSGGRI